MCDYQTEKAQAETLGKYATPAVPPSNRFITQHHAPSYEEIKSIANIRLAAENFMNAIDANCPPSADASDAKRKVREAMMTANASIVLRGCV